MKKLFFIIFLVIPFLLEGFGITFINSNISWYYVLLSVFLFFFIDKQKEINWPVLPIIFFSLFVFFSLISSIFFAADKQIAFEKTLFYLSSFLIFTFFYNRKELAKKYIRTVIISGTVIFIIVFLILKLFFASWIGNTFISGSEYNFVAALSIGHNHLGDFLGLTLISLLLFFLVTKKRIIWLYFFVILCFFLISFSRSAYFAFIVVIVLDIFIRNKSKIKFFLKPEYLIISISLIASIYLGVFVSVNRNYYLNKEIKPYLINVLSKRLIYWEQALKSIKSRPIFGIGAGNFGSLSYKYRQQPNDYTDTAHNLFIEVLAENGSLAFTGFALFMFIIVFSAFKNYSLYSLLFIYLLLNFQTDYTYEIYSFFVFFMILSGLVYREKNHWRGKTAYGILVILIGFILLRMGISHFFLVKKPPEFSVYFYPLNKQAHQQLIKDKQRLQDKKNARKAAINYERIFSEEPITLNFLIKFYEENKEKKKTLSLYERIYRLNRFVSFNTVKKIYELKKENQSLEKAHEFIKEVLINYQKNIPAWQIQENYQKEVEDFCLKNGEKACQEENFGGFQYFSEPDPKNQEKILKQIPYPESYSINKDTLNERFDYQIERPIETFRIVVLGDSSTFGLLVKTEDNWTELLEDRLNQNINNPKIKKIEVINLAVHGYDIPYEVERFRRRGLKYKPDLVLWFVNNSNFYQLNEIQSEKIKLISEKIERKEIIEEEIIKGNYYYIWEKAYAETFKEIGETGFSPIIKSYLNSFRQDYSGKMIIVGPVLDDKNKIILTEALGKEKVYFETIENLYKPQYQFPKYGQINEVGHQMISNEAFRFIKENKLIHI